MIQLGHAHHYWEELAVLRNQSSLYKENLRRLGSYL
jgi:hypothetical protein